MNQEDEYKKLHPILNEITKTFSELYTNIPNEINRKKLIDLEALLHENLEKIRRVKDQD